MFIDLDNPAPPTKVLRFPDSQPHITIPALADLPLGTLVGVRCTISSPEKLLLLLQAANAIDRHGHFPGTLRIPYLLAARFDRVMVPGDSLDLEVVANLINLAAFRRVELFDVHSDVAVALIRRAHNTTNESVVRQAAVHPETLLIVPDAGSAKKAARYREWNPHIAEEFVHCHKTRNPADGRVTLRVIDPGRCAGRHCLIVDDICDGGATFIEIARQIKPAHLTLAVSHGIFSKGLAPFVGHFHRVVTTTSYPVATRDIESPPPGLEVLRIAHPL